MEAKPTPRSLRYPPWRRLKSALRRDWEQTKHDLGRRGPSLEQSVIDTLKQALGSAPLPRPGTTTRPPTAGAIAEAEADAGHAGRVTRDAIDEARAAIAANHDDTAAPAAPAPRFVRPAPVGDAHWRVVGEAIARARRVAVERRAARAAEGEVAPAGDDRAADPPAVVDAPVAEPEKRWADTEDAEPDGPGGRPSQPPTRHRVR